MTDAKLKSSPHGNATHGRTGTREYKSWVSMKSRCYNPMDANYSRYGGRGIVVCDAWVSSFETFLADLGERPTGTSLDRTDGNGNYDPGNCRWATPKEQASNRRTNTLVQYDGKTMVLKDACKLLGIKYSTARTRLYRGLPWDVPARGTPA